MLRQLLMAKHDPSPPLVEMSLQGLMVDPVTKMPIVVLRDEDGNRVLPIWIGLFEANAIALELEKVKTPRPMTHDLLYNLVVHIGAVINQVTITAIKDSTYYALVSIVVDGGKVLEIDARPSDAVALALRAEAPIFASEDVLEDSKNITLSEEPQKAERLRNWLESLSLDEMGKYEM